MERSTTTTDPALTTAATVTSARPRRRWSDGPNYPWSPGTDDTWAVATHWPALVAVLCEEVAGGTHDIADDVERLRENGKLSRTDAESLRSAIESMRSAGMALQQIVRLGAGLYNLSPDRVDLGSLARTVVRERRADLARRRVEVSFDFRRAEVWVDGAIGAGLMHAAIDWALSFSNKVRLKVEPGDGIDPARIVVRGTLQSPSLTHAPLARNRRMNDNLHWVLLRQLATCARLTVSRSSTAATESAIVEFPATITVGPRRIG